MSMIRIIGCGNILSYDEGVGIHVVRRLNNEILPENVEIKELRVPGQFLEAFITGADKIIIIDACVPGSCRGITVARSTPSNNDLKEIFSKTMHAYNLYPLFGEDSPRTGALPEEIVIITIEIEVRNKFSVGLSKSVFSAVDNVVEKVMEELY